MTDKKPMRMKRLEDDVYIDWKQKLQPADTLGKPDDDTTTAQDHAMSNAMTLLGHSLDMGQMPSVMSFMGYPALQDISQNGLIRACIETVADDMTREFGKVQIKDDDESETVRMMEVQLRNFKIQKILHKAAEYVGYYGGCLIFIDTGADDATLQLPLNLTSKSDEMVKDALKGFILVDPINVFPGDYNSIEPLRDDFYKPRFWWVMGKRVHASRMIRIVANEVPQLYKPAYNFFGIAQAQILWDYVMHFQQCRVATAEMITKYSTTVFKTNMTEVLFQQKGYDELKTRIDVMANQRNNNSVIAIDHEAEDYVNVSAPMTGLTEISKQGLEFLAALNRTPAVKLLGISPSGFNATGESDIRNYYDHIRSQQKKVFGDAMRVILTCLQLHTLGEINHSMAFEWNELGNDDDAAIANVQKTKADTMLSFLDRNVVSAEEVRQAVVNDPDNSLSFIDPDDLPEQEMEGMEGMMGGMPQMGGHPQNPQAGKPQGIPQKPMMPQEQKVQQPKQKPQLGLPQNPFDTKPQI